MRTRVLDEARFLADQAIDPGLVQAQVARGRMHDVMVRRREALREVDLGLGAVGGVDHAVQHIVAAGEFGGGQQLPLGHPAQLPVPFAIAFEAHVHVEETERAAETLVGRHGAPCLPRSALRRVAGC